MVRRLPVLQTQAAEDAEAEARPPWHWILIGAGFVFTLWLPLAMLAVWLGRRLAGLLVDLSSPSELAAFQERASGVERVELALLLVGPVLLSFFCAGWVGGALVGRFGGRAGLREATLSGLCAALSAWGLAAASGALSPWALAVTSLLVLAPLGAISARIGSRFGLLRRPRGPNAA